MPVQILPLKSSQFLRGTIQLPASKSYSIRAFMAAAQGGRSVICGFSECEDARVARRMIRVLGSSSRKIAPDEIEISPGKNSSRPPVINVGESGTVLRLILPMIARMGRGGRVSGEGSLTGRPNAYLCETLRAMGADIRGTGRVESVPIRLGASKIHPGKIRIDGSLSSQFISALLMMCPRLDGDSVLELKGRTLVSSDYITMTLKVMERAGIRVQSPSSRVYQIPGGQSYRGLGRFRVPSDWGLAAFHMAAAALNPSNLDLKGYFPDGWPQADGHILTILEQMGVKLRRTKRSVCIQGPCLLKGGKFSLKDCPDLVPIVSVLALFAKGTTRLTHVAHARAKESDRIQDLRVELMKTGARVEATADGLVIHPLENPLAGRCLNAHNDHRLAMAFAVLGTRIPLLINEMDCCAKSYPAFIRDARALGYRIRRSA